MAHSHVCRQVPRSLTGAYTRVRRSLPARVPPGRRKTTFGARLFLPSSVHLLIEGLARSLQVFFPSSFNRIAAPTTGPSLPSNALELEGSPRAGEEFAARRTDSGTFELPAITFSGTFSREKGGRAVIARSTPLSRDKKPRGRRVLLPPSLS